MPIVASLVRPKELAGDENECPFPPWWKTRFGAQTSARAAVKGWCGNWSNRIVVGAADIAAVAFRPKKVMNEIGWRAMALYLMIPALGVLAGELFVRLRDLFVWFFSPLIFAADLTIPIIIGLAGEMLDWLRNLFVSSLTVPSVIAAGTLELVTGLASAYYLTRWFHKTKEGAQWKLEWDCYYNRQVR